LSLTHDSFILNGLYYCYQILNEPEQAFEYRIQAFLIRERVLGVKHLETTSSGSVSERIRKYSYLVK